MSVSGQTGIKSIQRVALTFPDTGYWASATIAAVNTSKTQVRLLGTSSSTNSNPSDFARLWLDNSTTVSAVRGGYTGALSLTVEVTEWF